MTQNSLAVHAHFRCGLNKTIQTRVSRTTSATQRVPEQRLPALPYERTVEAACFTYLSSCLSCRAYSFHDARRSQVRTFARMV